MALIGVRRALIRPKAVVAGGPVFAFKGTDSTNSGTFVFTSGPGGIGVNNNIDIGPARPDRLVIITTADQNGTAISSVTVNASPPLNLDVAGSGGPNVQIWSGLVTTGSGVATIVINYGSGAAFQGRVINVWTATGLASNLKKHTATYASSATTTINVNAGDFLIAAEPFAGVTFSTTDPTTPVPHSNGTVTPPTLIAYEWNTITNNATPLTVTASASLGTGVVASYR